MRTGFRNGLALPQETVERAARHAAHDAIELNSQAAHARHLAKRGQFDVGQLDELQGKASSTSRLARGLADAARRGAR